LLKKESFSKKIKIKKNTAQMSPFLVQKKERERTYQELQQKSGSPQDKPVHCHSRLHRCKRTTQHIADIQFYNCGTMDFSPKKRDERGEKMSEKKLIVSKTRELNLNKVRLILLISGRYETMHFTTQSHLKTIGKSDF